MGNIPLGPTEKSILASTNRSPLTGTNRPPLAGASHPKLAGANHPPTVDSNPAAPFLDSDSTRGTYKDLERIATIPQMCASKNLAHVRHL